MVHTGRAVVFEDSHDFHKRIDDDNLDVDETCILVLKNCGPKGYPGMAEVGNMPLPPKVLRKGITDMVRISDARMSGTAYGTVVLHTTPEAAAGGPLAIVQNGDMIELERARAAAPSRLATFPARSAPGLSCAVQRSARSASADSSHRAARKAWHRVRHPPENRLSERASTLPARPGLRPSKRRDGPSETAFANAPCARPGRCSRQGRGSCWRRPAEGIGAMRSWEPVA